jgi:hypothetical protein
MQTIQDMARFTSANAREMAAKSHASRRQREPVREEAPASPQTDPQLDPYVAERLVRARAEIARLTGLASKSTEALDCERFARSIANWSEIERNLAGRPAAGSFRPTGRRAAVGSGARSTDPL